MPRSVLIPVDGSDNSKRAFDFYVSDIRHADDLILLCHIQDAPTVSVVGTTEDWTSQIQEEINKGQKVITDYQITCENEKMAKKVIILLRSILGNLTKNIIYQFILLDYVNFNILLGNKLLLTFFKRNFFSG